MDTLLPKKAGGVDNVVTKNDDHHDALANDTTITAVPAGSTFGTVAPIAPSAPVAQTAPASGFGGGFDNANTSTSGSSAFGSTSAGGFGSTSGFGSSGASSFGSGSTGGFGGSSSGFGGSTGGFGGGMSGGMNGMSGNANIQQSQSQFQSIQNQSESIKNSGGAIQEGGENLVALDKDSTDWINKKWRPVMGWVYMLTCTCDFVLFPILWSILQALTHGNVTSQWQPLTLQGAGLYHVAMGAVLGIAAYGRTKEKVAGAA